MKILNAFAGFAHNTVLLDRAKHNITHIEYDADRYKLLSNSFTFDTVIHADAYKYIIEHHEKFDFIWASPPCQTHSRARIMQLSERYKNKDYKLPDFRLYELINFFKHFSRSHWLVENVIPYYKCIIKPTAQVGRHKVWSNFPIKSKQYPKDNIEGKSKTNGERDKTNPEMFPYILRQLKQNKMLEL